MTGLFQELLFFSSRRRHTRYIGDWSSDVCSSDLWTPLMRCFYTRFALENATLLGRFVPLATREYFRKAVEVYELGDGSRVDYLKQVLPTLRAQAGESEPLLEPPP